MFKIAAGRPLALVGPARRSRGELLAEGVLTMLLGWMISAALSRPGDNPYAAWLLAWGVAHGLVRGTMIGRAAIIRVARRWKA